MWAQPPAPAAFCLAGLSAPGRRPPSLRPGWGAALAAPHTLPCPRTLADCPQLLEVDDMVQLAVPDSKCVYTYIQELYRSLVQKGLVKTKKK